MTADPTYTPFGAPRRRQPPRLELLERCWRLRAQPTGRDLVCGIFETAAAVPTLVHSVEVDAATGAATIDLD